MSGREPTTPAPQPPTIEVVRASAAQAVAATSLRSIAREIGLSPMGLKHFLHGGHPYAATKQKLQRWYRLRLEREEGAIRIAAIKAALEVLVETMPPTLRQDAKSAVLDSLETVYRRRNLAAPGWIGALRGAR